MAKCPMPKRKHCKTQSGVRSVWRAQVTARRAACGLSRRAAQRPAVPTPPPPPLSLPPSRRLALPAGTYCNGVKQEAHELLTLRQMEMEQMEMVSSWHMKMEQMEAVDNTLVKMEAGESDQDDYTELCKNTIVSCEDDENDSDELANCIISSDDDANLESQTWISRSMAIFLRYGAFKQGLLTDSGWILLGTLVRHLQLTKPGKLTWKANLDPSMISTHDVLREVKQNGKPGKLPYFELFMSGQQVWVRATPGKRRHQ